MFVGIIDVDLLLPDDVDSLKDKRRHVRGLLAAIRKAKVSVAEVGHLDLLRRTRIGAAVVSNEMGQAREVLESVERLVAGLPEFEIISVRMRYVGDEDPSGRLP